MQGQVHDTSTAFGRVRANLHQIVGIILIVVMSALLKNEYSAPSWVLDNVHVACWIVVACTFVSLLLMLLFRGKLKRGDTEHSNVKVNAL